MNSDKNPVSGMTKVEKLFGELIDANEHILRDKIKDKSVLELRDRDGRTILFRFLHSGRLQSLATLIRSGAAVNIKDNNGWTPLHFTAQNFAREEAELLLNAGAEVDAVDVFGNTPLWRAVFCSQGRGELIKLLIEHGADPDLENKNGVSPRKLANLIANYDVKIYFK